MTHSSRQVNLTTVNDKEINNYTLNIVDSNKDSKLNLKEEGQHPPLSKKKSSSSSTKIKSVKS